MFLHIVVVLSLWVEMSKNTREHVTAGIYKDGVIGDWLTIKVKEAIREGRKQKVAQRKGEMIDGDRHISDFEVKISALS